MYKKDRSNKFGANRRQSDAAVYAKNTPRRAINKPMDSDRPMNFSELAPRGPMAVKNTVVGKLIENGEGKGIVIPDPSFKETNFGSVFISRENMNGAPYNMVVVAEVLNPNAVSLEYQGKIIEVLGK